MLGDDLILVQVDMAKDLSLCYNSRHPASARTKSVRACRGRRRAKRNAVFCRDSMCIGYCGNLKVDRHVENLW